MTDAGPALPASARTELLPFRLADFTRVTWVSDEARELWEPRFERVRAALDELEWRTVDAGLRTCAVRTLSPSSLVHEAQAWSEAGLGLLPIEALGEDPAAGSAQPVARVVPPQLRVVVGRDIERFRRAYEGADQQVLGDLLGTPSCCREFFHEVWVEAGMTDPTWPIAVSSGELSEDREAVDVNAPPLGNILWRSLGLRAIPHLPCRFDCTHSIELAASYMSLGRASGYGQELDWLEEILAWSVEWSALHGIAQLKTPILRLATSTDATAGIRVVRWHGSAFPAEGARGLAFPYRRTRSPLSSSAGFKRGLRHARESVSAGEPSTSDSDEAGRAPRLATQHPKSDSGDAQPDWLASENGFVSAEQMSTAHAPIVDLAAAVLGRAGGAVLDLGCGNGALLLAIRARVPSASVYGVDRDAARIEHARQLHSDLAENFRALDMFEPAALEGPQNRFELILVRPRSLRAISRQRAERFIATLCQRSMRLLAYDYGEWPDFHGSVSQMAELVGLRTVTVSGTAGLIVL